MKAAKARAAKSAGGKGPVKKRPAGRRIMKTQRVGDACGTGTPTATGTAWFLMLQK